MTFLYKNIYELVKSKGITIRQLERDANLSNGSIRRWNNTIPNIENVQKVAKVLGVSIDFLTNDIDWDKTLYVKELSKMESDLIDLLRLLDDKKQEDIFDIINLLYKKTTQQTSVYSTCTINNKQKESGSIGKNKTAPHETALNLSRYD